MEADIIVDNGEVKRFTPLQMYRYMRQVHHYQPRYACLSAIGYFCSFSEYVIRLQRISEVLTRFDIERLEEKDNG